MYDHPLNLLNTILWLLYCSGIYYLYLYIYDWLQNNSSTLNVQSTQFQMKTHDGKYS